MNSRAFKAIILTLILVLLFACTGTGPLIPNTGGDNPIEVTQNEPVSPSPSVEPASPEAAASATPIVPADAETPACQTAIATIKSNNAYLREGPDIRFQANSQYTTGDQITVLGRYKDWFKVESSDGNQGWLYTDWISIPQDIDTSTLCPISEQELPPTPQTLEQPEKECEPTYYDSCE